MNQADSIVVHVLAGDGRLPDDFESVVEGITVAGMPVAVRKVGRRALPGGPPIGVTSTFPLDNFLKIREDELAGLKAAVKSFYEINDNRCNFSLQATAGQDDNRREINIASENLNRSTVDNFFHALSGSAAELIKAMEMPHPATWAIYINIDSLSASVKNVTAFDITARDFYILDMTTGVWVKQVVPEEEK